MVSAITFLSLSLLLTVGLYASYTDIRFRRIENRWTFVLIGAGVLSQIVFGVLGYTSATRILILFGIALALAFSLYFFGLWSPGDAKLFWGISLLLPPTLTYGQLGSLPTEYPPVALLINAFVPYFVLFLAITLVRGAWRTRGKEQTSHPSLKSVLDVLYRLTAFVGLMFGLMRSFPSISLFSISFSSSWVASTCWNAWSPVPISGRPCFRSCWWPVTLSGEMRWGLLGWECWCWWDMACRRGSRSVWEGVPLCGRFPFGSFGWGWCRPRGS